MIRTDLWLVALVFAFYLFECLRFLKPNEVAYTGVLTSDPRRWGYQPSSYTLFGRHLCLVNPILVGAGVAVFRDIDPIAELTYSGTRLRAALRLIGPSVQWLSVLCSAMGLVLFVALPVVVCLHLLQRLWAPLLTEILLLHTATCILFIRELRRWQRGAVARLSTSLAVLLNPLGAIRCVDVLSQSLFEELNRQHSTRATRESA
jgi:hypothetical protein